MSKRKLLCGVLLIALVFTLAGCKNKQIVSADVSSQGVPSESGNSVCSSSEAESSIPAVQESGNSVSSEATDPNAPAPTSSEPVYTRTTPGLNHTVSVNPTAPISTRTAPTKQLPRSWISAGDIDGVGKGTSVRIADDSLCQGCWEAKNPQTVLTEVTGWLKSAEPYGGEIPKTEQKVVFKANVAPSEILISVPGGHTVSLQPVYYFVSKDGKSFQERYVENVVKYDDQQKVCYLTSASLYNWLLKDQWKPEFKRM